MWFENPISILYLLNRNRDLSLAGENIYCVAFCILG